MSSYSGLKHIPVRPLTPEEELAVVAAARDDQSTSVATPTSSSAVTSGGSIIRANSASQHVKAFSGKGHTLSSASQTLGSALGRGYTLGSATAPMSNAATTNSTFSQTVPNRIGAALENSARRMEIESWESGRGGASGTSNSLHDSATDGREVPLPGAGGGSRLEWAQRLSQNEEYTDGQERERVNTSDKSALTLRLLQDQELSLQNLVRGTREPCL